MSLATLAAVLERAWLQPELRCELQRVELDDGRGLRVLRDDLLHPLVGGNKLRKLDGLLPALQADGVTDVVTCGGVQSSHASAVALCCAERGLRAHLVLRGERPATPTGYALTSLVFAHAVHFVSRGDYAERAALLEQHAAAVRAALPGARVAIVAEGAGEVRALYGCVRLVLGLAQALGPAPRHLVLDAGTGTTAAGLALGIALCGLDWSLDAVCLMPGGQPGCEARAAALWADFRAHHGDLERAPQPPRWLERTPARRFGRILPDELARCLALARRTGLLLDPLYTLAAWDHAARLDDETLERTVLVHTGGLLNLMGIAQRHAVS